MADKPEEDKAPIIGSLLVLSVLILSIVAFILAVNGVRQANTTENKLNNLGTRLDSLNKRIERQELKTSPASPGGGVGENVPTQPEGNTIPNASGH